MTDECINVSEAAERAHLERVRTSIKLDLDKLGHSVDSQYSDVIELKHYLQENKTDMDHAEKASVRQSIEQMAMIGDHSAKRKRQLHKLYQNAYFGRIDFRPGAGQAVHPVYIGIHAFHDHDRNLHLVHDWRAPIASMFYDFELGEAFFDAPEGRVDGALILKRQYRIKQGTLEFMLETSLNIHDEILQQELSRASDDKMKNIVATIQRDQNAIIRNAHTHALVIQGAAGSGKTSIALHRIAFLLYKFKDNISAKDILIISPNNVFAHYISKVLPELGEEMIQATTMEALGDYLLDYKVPFQSFYEQVATLLEARDDGYSDRILFKAMPDFLDRLEDYARHVRNSNLRAADLEAGGHSLPAAWIAERFHRCGAMPYARQINQVTEAIVSRMQLEYGLEITGKARAGVRTQLKKMFTCMDLLKLYRTFYDWLDRPDMFQTGPDKRYEYADVFPLIYLKMLLEGAQPHDRIKHLVIDEMQDYTSVQYQVIARLFRCRKTILGDQNQAVNPFSASSAETIRERMPYAECIHMNKSYRSTLQITQLAQQINRNERLIPIARHGDEPDLIFCADTEEEFDIIRQRVQAFLDADHNSLGVICKTQKQARTLFDRLRDLDDRIHLLHAGSTTFNGGVSVATAHLTKGLEFDQVIVPFCNAANYRSLMDRHMLYVACTRAMHKLSLTHTGNCSPFLRAVGAGKPARHPPARPAAHKLCPA
ncbi:MAG: UvrD-helicase domain-containing protein [Kiritimatiellia bacterium]|nr:AAA family ATPase [Lentisphaerota bacterium]